MMLVIVIRSFITLKYILFERKLFLIFSFSCLCFSVVVKRLSSGVAMGSNMVSKMGKSRGPNAGGKNLKKISRYSENWYRFWAVNCTKMRLAAAICPDPLGQL